MKAGAFDSSSFVGFSWFNLIISFVPSIGLKMTIRVEGRASTDMIVRFEDALLA